MHMYIYILKHMCIYREREKKNVTSVSDEIRGQIPEF